MEGSAQKLNEMNIAIRTLYPVDYHADLKGLYIQIDVINMSRQQFREFMALKPVL